MKLFDRIFAGLAALGAISAIMFGIAMLLIVVYGGDSHLITKIIGTIVISGAVWLLGGASVITIGGDRNQSDG